jgi:hypothetical protein
MATALERCSRESIKIETSSGPEEVKAWRMGIFACHPGIGQHRGRWVITHIESGSNLSSRGVFLNEDDAAEAMEQISAEGDWSDLSLENLKRLGAICKRVFAANHAVEA